MTKRRVNPAIRDATAADAAAIAAIYAEHVLTGAGTYEIVPPDRLEMSRRMARVLEAGWPWLIAEVGGRIVGFCYASQIIDRAGYRYTAEDSIYVAGDSAGCGVGTALLRELVRRAAIVGFRQMIAVIGGSEVASVALHAKLGFTPAGRLEAVGWKHGRWLDSVYMQRTIGEGSASPGALQS